MLVSTSCARQMSRGCLISANELEREADFVAPAEGLVDKPVSGACLCCCHHEER
jgi:hypothetical protein